jgi:MFS family permease
MVAIALFELGSVAATLLILRGRSCSHRGEGSRQRPFLAFLLYLAHNVAATLASMLAGHASDRMGSVGVLALGVGAFLLAYTLFAAAGSDGRRRWVKVD